MHNSKTFLSGICGGLVLFCCLCAPVRAGDAVTYSPEQWPKRWSSAIRQQQSGRYPERREAQTLNDYDGETFSDEDLFLNSPEEHRYENRHRQRRGWGHRSHYEDRDARYRDRRYAYGARRYPNWPMPYQGYPYAAPGYQAYPAYPPPYAGYGLYGLDPLSTYPGLGLGYPSLLGPSMGYPYPGLPGLGLLGAPYLW